MLSLVFNERLSQPLIIICFLLPIFQVYAYEASVSLKVWLTVQELPPPPRIESSGNDASQLHKDLDNRISNHANRDLVVFLFLVSPFIFDLLAELVKDESPSSVDVRARILLYLPLVCIGARMLDTLAARDMELDEMYAIRTSNGIPFLAIGKRYKQLGFRFPIAALLFGTFVASYALCMQGMLSSYFSYHLVLLFLVVSSHERATVLRFRGRMKVAVLFALIAVVNVGLAPLGRRRNNDSLNTGGGKTRAVEWESLLVSCFFSYLPFEVIALCYRFDYVRAKARGEVSTRNVGFELSGVKKVGVQTLFDVQLPQGSEAYYGIRVPSTRPSAIFSTADPKFPKPYYLTALSGVGLSAVLVFFLSSETIGLDFTGLATFDSVGLYLLPFTLPLMYILVLLRASGRGELRLLWDYEERWQSTVHQIYADGSDPSKDGENLDVPPIPGSDSNHKHHAILEEIKIDT